MPASSEPGNESTSIPFEVKWETNVYNQPALVNQISMSPGPTTQFGSDGIYYLLLGHVMPPMGAVSVADSGVMELSVMPAGQFALTLERVRELHQILGLVIADAEEGRNDENSD